MIRSPHLPAVLLAAVALGTADPAAAQAHPHHHQPPPPPAADHAGMDPSRMDHSSMDHSSMDHSGMDHALMDHALMDPAAMDHAEMDHGTAPPQAPREPIPAVTAADRAAAFPVIDHSAMQHASPVNHLLRVERLEHGTGHAGTHQAWEVNGWLGTDVDRLWLRSEGERDDGRTGAADLELLYGRSVSPWWDVLVGIRQDLQPGGHRRWAALGLQGLAPYKFETSATLYLGSNGQVMAKGEVEYDVLLTNRLILQPRVEATLALRDERQRDIGDGLNTVEAGVRLRYEVTRRFAPYVGVSHERLFGDTADQADHRRRDTRWVAGVRLWF